MALKGRLNEFYHNNDLERRIRVVEFFKNGLRENAKIPTVEAVSTGGNLNSDRIKQITLMLGLDYSPYELKANLLDAQLLHFRNNIAHGKGLCPSESDFTLLFTEVLGLLRCYRNQIENAAALRLYEAKA